MIHSSSISPATREEEGISVHARPWVHPSVMSPVWMTKCGLNSGRIVEVNSRKLTFIIFPGFLEMCVSDIWIKGSTLVSSKYQQTNTITYSGKGRHCENTVKHRKDTIEYNKETFGDDGFNE